MDIVYWAPLEVGKGGISWSGHEHELTPTAVASRAPVKYVPPTGVVPGLCSIDNGCLLMLP